MKNYLISASSASRCLAAAVLLIVGILSASAAGGTTSTYYYNATVSVYPNGSGKVYVSNQNTTNPNYQTTSNTGTQSTYSQKVTLYLYAQANEQYIFSKWQQSNNGTNNWYDITVSNNNNIQITATSDSRWNPDYFYFRAVFEKQTGVVKVAVAKEGRGSVSINPVNNQVGGQVTLTATPDASNGVHFLGWNKDPNDTEHFIDTRNPYTIDIITSDNLGTYYAHFSKAQESIYCRIQNKATKRFLTLYGNKEAVKHFYDGKDYDDGFIFDRSLKLIEESSAKGNPMTVFLRSGTPAGAGITNGVNLVAYNIGYNDLLPEDAATNQYPLTMVTTNNGVQIFTSYTTHTDDGDMTHDTYLTDEGGDYAVMQADNTKNTIYWDVFLLEEENTQGSFGANAKAEFSGNGTYGENGKYYTTMFTDFPYRLGDGVKAYYLPLSPETYDEKNKKVHFTEIADIVPGNSAVVLECPSDYDGTNNRLFPLLPEDLPEDAPASLPYPDTNLLNGYISISNNGADPNKDVNNKSSMFILSKVDGDLGWYYYTNDYMTPNKAYLDLSPWDELYHQNERLARELRFVFGKDDDGATGIIAPKYAEKVDGPLFDLNGRRVADGDAYGLKKGIYVTGGKKIVVK